MLQGQLSDRSKNFCRTKRKFTDFVRQSCSFPEDLTMYIYPTYSKKKKIKIKTSNVSTVHGCPLPQPLAPPRGMTLGQRYHTLKGLDVGKCHTKFQLFSPEGIEVISFKRNADINLHLHKLAGEHESGYERDIHTYAHTDITSWRNTICPTPAKGRRGHKK